MFSSFSAVRRALSSVLTIVVIGTQTLTGQALVYPATPAGEFTGGRFQFYFNNMFVNCPISQFVTGIDGSGNLLCDISGGSVGADGIDGSVQFNSGGILAGNGAEFFWDRINNRLGLGKSTPGVRLDIQTTAAAPTFLRAGFASGQTLQLLAGTGRAGIVQLGTGAFIIATNSDGNLVTPSNERLRVTASGNVGINRINPAYRLDVAGTGNFDELCINGDCKKVWPGDATGTLNYLSKFDTPSGLIESQLFDNGSNVGIDTTLPVEKLDINGNLALKGQRFLWASSLNIGIGWGALNFINGGNNVAIGNNTLSTASFGSIDNVAVGNSALLNNQGQENVAVGTDALRENGTGSANVALGRSALRENIRGISNTAIGYEALRDNIQGTENAAFGYAALLRNVSGSQNTVIGNYAMQRNIDGNGNTAIGDHASDFNSSGNYNTSVGGYALGNNQTGTGGVAVGYAALANGSEPFESTAIGTYALQNSTGQNSTAVGFGASRGNSSGWDNTALGTQALGNDIF